jgi:hypothetical protein
MGSGDNVICTHSFSGKTLQLPGCNSAHYDGFTANAALIWHALAAPTSSTGKTKTMNALKIAVAAGTLSFCCFSQAAENESIFIANQGRLIIPHLILGNEVYYVQLERTGTAYSFNLLGPSVTKVIPNPNDNWATAEQILGDWKIKDDEEIELSIEADGTFTLNLPADLEEPCPAGMETGRYSYNADTGVFSPRVITDANGICGLSHPTRGGEGPFRMHMGSNGLEFWVYDPTEPPPFPQVMNLIPR